MELFELATVADADTNPRAGALSVSEENRKLGERPKLRQRHGN